MGRSLSTRTYIISRETEQGFIEETTFVGNIKQKPKGWRVEREVSKE